MVEVCFRADCGNEARVTDEHGQRVCGLCSAGLLSLRDGDHVDLLRMLNSLLNVLDNQMISAGINERLTLRNMISRGSTK